MITKSLSKGTALLIFVMLSIFCLSAQTKKQIKENGIKSTTIWESDLSTGKANKRLVSVEKFNAKGLISEFSDYDKNGKLKERTVYKYNGNNDVVEEIHFDSNNKLDKTYKYTYEGELKKTKEKYDHNNKLLWKKEFVYEK